jgi:DNA-binding response OmpR family regulator
VTELPFILVVEDEYLLHRDIEEALVNIGFATDIVSSGEQALTLFAGGNKGYRALIADVHLGGRLNGWETARLIREMRPALPVIYMTAARADDWAAHGVPNSIIVSKPFTAAQLLTSVSQLLNTRN